MSECEFPKQNAAADDISAILKNSKTVAVIGLSPKPDRPSHEIAQYLLAHGYRVIGVNPGHPEILGQKVYKTLADVPEPVDIVDIFRDPSAVPGIVDEAIAKGAKTVWMQLGIVHNDAAERARAAGLNVVMNKCILVEHARRNG
jgi:predicted CoA-binding protein